MYSATASLLMMFYLVIKISLIRHVSHHRIVDVAMLRPPIEGSIERVLQPLQEDDVKFRVVGCFAPPLDCAVDLNKVGGRQIVGAR